jgi:hypothetical protein
MLVAELILGILMIFMSAVIFVSPLRRRVGKWSRVICIVGLVGSLIVVVLHLAH